MQYSLETGVEANQILILVLIQIFHLKKKKKKERFTFKQTNKFIGRSIIETHKSCSKGCNAILARKFRLLT